ncbi:signal transduction histidine kinase/ligand-binding sensor domain-containing protein [Duganella sp. 1224]|uniref:sensor histidine kinase n=1 Tax=Duganella sp. 1224 TaxID=2587052 RepID=UPI0015C99E1F|nr:sensor histidine kinase [Duganella sp. 1224]NYE59938.1 signal transduction histidine kinase/ligand-binding sensor domain-containing protein [Duganella sp. 1224]
MAVRWILPLAAWLCWGCACAASAPGELAFQRRSWTQAEGAPTAVWRIAQSDDGLLWFATGNGLYRYDGERFQRVERVYGHRLRSNNVVAVEAIQGGIAVGYQFGGLSTLTPAAATHYSGGADGLPAGTVHVLRRAPDGLLYVGTQRAAATFDGKVWRRLAAQALPDGIVNAIVIDRDQTTWVTVDWKLYSRARGASAFTPAFAVTYGAVPNLVRGRLAAEVGGKAVQAEAGKPPVALQIPAKTDRSHGLWDGPYGTLWAWVGDDAGLCLLREAPDGKLTVAQSFEAGGSLGRLVTRTLIDRENNFWVATANGIERYRAQRIHEAGVPRDWLFYYVQRGLDDDLYVAGDGEDHLLRLTADGHQAGPRLAGVMAMWREHAGSVWTGSASGLSHITRAGVTTWPLPADTPPGRQVQTLTVDKAGVVWVSILRQGLYRFADGQWTHVSTEAVGGDPTPVYLYAGPSGRIWIGFVGGRLAEIVGDAVRPVSKGEDVNIGNVFSLLEVDGRLLAGGEAGVAWVDGARLRPLRPTQASAFLGISGMVQDRAGDLWLHGLDGIVHITRAELAAFWADSGRRVDWEIFNFEDGVHGHPAQLRPLPTLALAHDGRVVYATLSQVGWIDPAGIRRNRQAPTVLIDAVHAGDTTYSPGGTLSFVPGTSAVDIKFAATALSVPERVAFRYQLGGVDAGWQAPHGERSARYTNLAPGSYTFRVIAANEDGVWSQQGASVTFSIQPQVWQTWWFRLLAAAAGLLGVSVVYRWRMEAVAAREAEKAATRLGERQRIARTLHDNLLQGMHTLILRCHTVLMRLPHDSHEQRTLDHVLQQAEKLVEDTRDEVMELRTPEIASAVLCGLKEALEAMEPSLAGRLAVAVGGHLDKLKSQVARELFQVVREAAANAARHSRAAHIDVVLDLATDAVHGAVSDDGVGIPAAVAVNGRAGHWGLTGMRERVANLGGELAIEARAGGGTVIRFAIPAGAAYTA